MRAVGHETGSSDEDVLLSRLYQQVTELHEPRFGAEYDLEKGLKRYRTWLGEQTEYHGALPVAETIMAIGAVTPDAFLPPATARVEWSPDLAVVELYSQHYRALVRLAALLVRDTPTAEEVVQDAFIAEHGALVLLERSAVVAALRGLPDRQREAIVLRYYADLSEAEIATAMGISRGAVKSHTARGMAALRAALEQELW